MKPDQIRAIKAAELGEKEWLKEIALQLALLNEPKKAGRPPKVKNA